MSRLPWLIEYSDQYHLFRDGLKASTIGWIVGGVLVGVLLILIILVALWAKAAGKLCFGDDGYGHPNDPKRRPRTQVYRFTSYTTNIVDR